MAVLVDKNTRLIVQGITGKVVPSMGPTLAAV
jgi:succinyl-CoA synthetase alpha subunit